MLNFRYILRLLAAFVTRFKVLILLSVVLGAAIFFIVRLFLPFILVSSTQRVGLVGRYTSTTLPNSILGMVSSGLTKLDANGAVEPDLAASWETPDKGKTWTFILKNGLLWQDGKKLTSSSISYQFSDVSVETPDDKTITFKLQNEYSAFPVVVAKPTFKTGLLGTGEWQVKKLSLAGPFVDEISLEKKDGEKITYKFYPTEERAILAFELGQVDTVKDLLNPSPLDAWKRAKVETTSQKGEYVAVFFNTQDKILSDKNLRQALSYAIDKASFQGQRAIGPISVLSWAYNPQVKPYNFDPEKSKEMIDEYKKNSGSEELTINLTVAPVLLVQAEKIKANWENVGVKVNLQVLATIPNDYQSLLAIFDEPDDPDQYSVWHSTQVATNITHYQNPRIDKLLEDGRSELDLSERKKIYLDFQRFLVEDSPAAFLYYPSTYTIGRR